MSQLNWSLGALAVPKGQKCSSCWQSFKKFIPGTRRNVRLFKFLWLWIMRWDDNASHDSQEFQAAIVAQDKVKEKMWTWLLGSSWSVYCECAAYTSPSPSPGVPLGNWRWVYRKYAMEGFKENSSHWMLGQDWHPFLWAWIQLAKPPGMLEPLASKLLSWLWVHSWFRS